VCISDVSSLRRDDGELALQLTRSARRRAYTSGCSVIDHELRAEPPCSIARWKRFRPAHTRAARRRSIYHSVTVIWDQQNTTVRMVYHSAWRATLANSTDNWSYVVYNNRL